MPGNPSKRTLSRWKREAKELGNDENTGNFSSETSDSSDSAEQQQRKLRKTNEEADESSAAESDNEATSHDAEDVIDNKSTSDRDEAASESDAAQNNDDNSNSEQASDDHNGSEHDEEGNGGNDLDGNGEGVQLGNNVALNDQDEELLNDGAESSGSSEEASESDSDDDDENDEESEEEDEDEEEEEANVEVVDGDQLLYPTARITLMESLILILTLALRFSLSGECLSRILELIEIHCPAGNLCKKTLYTFKNYFAEIGRSALILHYYCEHCMSEMESKDSICERCLESTKVAFFIEIPLIQQLQRLFLRAGFLDQLMYRFNRVKKHPENYEDIYDGSLYREQMQNGFLSHIYNISLMWYTDGVQIFKSATYSVWPLFFCINELNYKARTSRENTLLCGLWFGKSKPKPNLFLKPFRSTFNTFKNDGFRFKVPNGDTITVRGKLLCGTCDLQAKSLFLRSKLYSGYYGCSKCYSRGVRAPAGRTSVHVHPFTPPANVRLRQNADVLECARVARQTGKSHVLGIKGLSMLYFMMPDMIRGTGVDIMHQVFLGISKLVTKFWFDPKFSDQPFSCSAMVDLVNERLSSIKPPSFVQRMTRSLLEKKQWKAKEYKLWFFYYSIPVLSGILPNEYLFHHVKLVSGIAALNQESIFPDQVNRAGSLLNDYVRDFEQLYALRFMGMNVHLLTHLADVVRELGPLWVCSCFFFEDLNGQIVKLIHGAFQPGIQLMSSASLFMSLNLQIDKLQENSIAKEFCLKIRQYGSKYTTAEIINEKTVVTGRNAFARNVPLEFIELIMDKLDINGGNVLQFFTLRKKGVFYNSALKPATLNRCCKYILCDHEGAPVLGEIRCFIRLSECICVNVCSCLPASFYCIVKVYERIPWLIHEVPEASIFYLFAVKPTENLILVPCDKIVSSCFYAKINNIEYLARPVNALEYE